MSTQLRKNALHFSNSLEAEKPLLEQGASLLECESRLLGFVDATIIDSRSLFIILPPRPIPPPIILSPIYPFVAHRAQPTSRASRDPQVASKRSRRPVAPTPGSCSERVRW
jgi:hypothetical protein